MEISFTYLYGGKNIQHKQIMTNQHTKHYELKRAVLGCRNIYKIASAELAIDWKCRGRVSR